MPALVMILAGSTLFSCSPAYVMRAAWEEARILVRRRAISDMLNDRGLPPETRAKLELVVEARSFAERELDLDPGNSYLSYADIGRDTLALVLSASPADRLEPHTWSFPIVGRVPYKGFFRPDLAERERRRLQELGYDTYLRPTSAFSTLGWLPDPLLSTVLRQDSLGLVETVIHEITHNTLFVSGHVRFNESFANYVGSVGAIEFFCRPGRDPDACTRARDAWHDTVRFGAFLDDLWDELAGLYALGLDREEVLRRRVALLEEVAERYRRDIAPVMRLPGFARFDPTRLNNASLIARHLYYHRLGDFERLHERLGGLRPAIDAVRGALDGAEDPWTAIEALTGAAGAALVPRQAGRARPGRPGRVRAAERLARNGY